MSAVRISGDAARLFWERAACAALITRAPSDGHAVEDACKDADAMLIEWRKRVEGQDGAD